MQEGKFVGSLQQWSTSPTDRFDCFALPKLGPSKATQQRGNATHAPWVNYSKRFAVGPVSRVKDLVGVCVLSLSLAFVSGWWQLYVLLRRCRCVVVLPMTPPLPKQRGTHWWYYSQSTEEQTPKQQGGGAAVCINLGGARPQRLSGARDATDRPTTHPSDRCCGAGAGWFLGWLFPGFIHNFAAHRRWWQIFESQSPKSAPHFSARASQYCRQAKAYLL